MCGKLVGLGEVLVPPLEGLFTNHSTAVAFHRGAVGGDQLCRHHAFQFVLRPDAGECGNGGPQLLVVFFRLSSSPRAPAPPDCSTLFQHPI